MYMHYDIINLALINVRLVFLIQLLKYICAIGWLTTVVTVLTEWELLG